jgi:uncharacterized lipoprotein YddW (UPF0748 family)
VPDRRRTREASPGKESDRRKEELEMKHSEGVRLSGRGLPGQSIILILLGVLLLSRVIPGAMPPGLGPFSAAAEEARCSWFTRFEWNDRQDIVDEIDNLAACNTNAILFQIRGEADAFYISEHEPWSRLVGNDYPGYDPLAVAIYEAHRRGMELHAYVNAMPAWGGSSMPVSPDHIYNAHPEWIMVDENGEPMEYPFDYGYAFVSPGIPQAREHIVKVIMDIAANYDVDGIHLDYIRYPYPTYSHDDSSLARFVREYGGCTPETCENEWDEFRRTLITEVVEATHDSVTALKDWVKFSAAVWGVFIYGYDGYFQDSHGWLEDGIMDFTAPMIYTADTSDFQSRLHDHAVNKYDRHVYAGIGTYYTGMTPEIMVQEIEICRDENVEGQTMFSASDLHGDYRTALIESGGPYEFPDGMPEMAWKGDPPFIASVALPVSGSQVDVLFNRDVDLTSGQNIANYSFQGGLAATSAVRNASDHRLIHLITTPQHPESLYTLTVTGVADEGSKETVAWPNNRRKFYGLSGSGVEIIVDNEDGAPKFTVTGSWNTSTYGNCWLANKRYHVRDTVNVDSATWMTPISIPGEYAVYFWVNDENYAADAHYYLDTHAGPDSAIGNQNYTDPEGWQLLGTFPFSDTARVSVTTYWKGAGLYVVADAIKWIYSGPLEPDAPPAAIDDLASAKSAGDITLTWSPVSQDTAGNPLTVDRYVVYRDDDPTSEPADSIGFTTGTDYTDPGAAGLTSTNYYYVIRAASDTKGKSAPSNRVGEFDIDLGNGKRAAGGEGGDRRESGHRVRGRRDIHDQDESARNR